VHSISVVVPTRRRPELLARCTAALDRQTVSVEIIVVDDSAGRGPAAARNEGVRRARAEVVCFTDDDCIPRSDWAERLVSALAEANVAGGRTVTLGRVLDEATQLVFDHVSERETFFPTMNLACRRELLLAEPFDESFRVAEDREWCTRLAARGHRFATEPLAVVEHRPELSPVGFLRRHYRYGRGAWNYHRACRGHRAQRAPGFHRSLLSKGFKTSPGIGLAVVASQAATTAGYAREALKRA
jgi:glycosyltransferase involved in cell wall biosynthesis